MFTKNPARNGVRLKPENDDERTHDILVFQVQNLSKGKYNEAVSLSHGTNSLFSNIIKKTGENISIWKPSNVLFFATAVNGILDFEYLPHFSLSYAGSKCFYRFCEAA